MEFSLFYFADDASVNQPAVHAAAAPPEFGKYRLLLEGARIADREGLCAIWTPERHFNRFGGLYPNPAIAGAAIASITERVQIRAGSVVAPLHDPIQIVEDWSVVDNLSGGRVGLSFASGWHATDFVLRPEAYAHRRRQVAESIEEVRRLWCGEPLAAKDGGGRQVEVSAFPAPVQDMPRMWLTAAGSPETFRTAGRLNVGLLTYLLGQEREELADKIREYRAAARRASGNSWSGHVVAMVPTYLDVTTELTRERVSDALRAYLTSSFGLIAGSLRRGAAKLDPATLSPADVDVIVDRSLDHYYDNYALFGTVAQAADAVERLAEVGIDEIACLIDFGVEPEHALAGIPRIAELGREFA
ncbi:MupA/Atu3671 family FMN-dependent luciferase-like monooxygenase [Kitasatospora sp. NPDC056651]|uniref:MupA/Atu3671 family FMN-dependent luciferase-like monooxygenase n=1 Tax=Kitasatospora sp. NPDC056651 TaxID=3345892 RepID=UPI00369E2CAC